MNISATIFPSMQIKETNFLRNTIAECLACGKQHLNRQLTCTSFKLNGIIVSYCLSVRTGIKGNPTDPDPPPSPGTVTLNPQPLTQCPHGTCFRQNLCIPVKSGGFRCAPCPDGFTGDGKRCDDVDEVDMCGTCVAGTAPDDPTK